MESGPPPGPERLRSPAVRGGIPTCVSSTSAASAPSWRGPSISPRMDARRP